MKLNNAAAKRWAKAVKSGKAKIKGQEADTNDAEGIKGFLLGNQKDIELPFFISREANFDGLVQIFDRYDIKLQYEEESFKHLADFITSTVKQLPAKSKIRKEIEELYKP